jgi:hypothetical protein
MTGSLLKASVFSLATVFSAASLPLAADVEPEAKKSSIELQEIDLTFRSYNTERRYYNLDRLDHSFDKYDLGLTLKFNASKVPKLLRNVHIRRLSQNSMRPLSSHYGMAPLTDAFPSGYPHIDHNRAPKPLITLTLKDWGPFAMKTDHFEIKPTIISGVTRNKKTPSTFVGGIGFSARW